MSGIRISIITSLYRCKDFLGLFLQHYAAITNLAACELVLVHNDPTEEELAILQAGINDNMRVVHLVVEREGLYASWNRAVAAAKGTYLAIWNVDDIRTPDSLRLQQLALEESRAGMCYGDFYGTRQYGAFTEKLYQYPEYEQAIKEGYKRHIIGCFPMWRRDIHLYVGYFDEQFKLVSDYEFQLRVIRRFSFVKASGILGYYLENVPHKLSSNRRLQYHERTTVELRYGMYHKILMHHLPATRSYRVKQMLNFNKWIPVKEAMPAKAGGLGASLSLLTMPFFYSSWLIKKSMHLVYSRLFKLNRPA